MTDLEYVKIIAQEVHKYGGSTYFVGGYVRDRLLNIESKDIDIEIHGLSKEQILNIISKVGIPQIYGDSFEVISLAHSNIDISYVEANVSKKQACMRRDFTMNAMMQDVLSDEIIDYFDGKKHIKDKQIHVISKQSLIDDPLRVYRMAQFAARFQFDIAQESMEYGRKIDLKTIKQERILEELRKVMLKSTKPSIFFTVLKTMNQLEPHFSELKALIDLKQNQIHHEEKDGFTHTMMGLDEASKVKDLTKNPFYFMMSALCHDFGKAVTTTYDQEIIHSYEHEIKGIPLVETFIKRLSNEKALCQYVTNMTLLHMKPNVYAMNQSKVKKTNAMFYESVDPMGLIQLALCDDKGRICHLKHIDTQPFLMQRLNIYEDMLQKEYVSGKDLIACGIKPDANFKLLLDYALKLRLANVSKQDALKQVLSYERKLKKV